MEIPVERILVGNPREAQKMIELDDIELKETDELSPKDRELFEEINQTEEEDEDELERVVESKVIVSDISTSIYW